MISNPLKQATAKTVRIGPFVDATDGVTAETSLAITQSDVRLALNHGDFAQMNAAPNSADELVHDEAGYYLLPLDDTDTGTLGNLRVSIKMAGAAPFFQDFTVISASAYAALFGSGVPELTGDPGAEPDPFDALMLLFMALRNKLDATAEAKEIHNNAGSAILAKALSNDGTTYSEAKVS